MGWSYGVVEGKEVGYGVEAICEHPGCKNKIDRGLAYACGNDIGSSDTFCNGFFCGDHLYYSGKDCQPICAFCVNEIARRQHKKLPFPEFRNPG